MFKKPGINEISGEDKRTEIMAKIVREHLPNSINRRPEQEEGFITVDREENITYINKTLSHKLGYEQLQLVGESVRKLTVEEDFQRITELTGKRKDGLASSYIMELKTSKGNSILFRVSAAPLYSANEFLGTMGIFSDLTQEKANLDSIIETIQYHELMAHYLPMGLIILSSEGIVININPAFTILTGMTTDDIIGRHILKIEFLSNLSYRYLLENLLRFQVNFDQETDLLEMKNGNAVYLNLRGFHLKLDNGISYYLLIFGDISERKRTDLVMKQKMEDLVLLEQQLKAQILSQEKELREKEWQLLEQHRIDSNNALLAKIAHYWRQPLNNSTVLIQSMQDDYNYGELDKARFFSKVDSAVGQLAELSRTLETFRYLADYDSGESRFNIKEAIMQAVDLIKPNYRNGNAFLSLNLEDDIYTDGYPRRFTQALVNMIDNSILAFQERKINNPLIYINLEYDARKIIILIGDNAGGIEADIATRIFDPYFTTRTNRAQGIGLYQSKRVITEMFNGSIDYKRTDKGSEFIIIIQGLKK
ncbi:MAG: PAS domain-containing sensor histidine kinase [Candidatus Cloacimonetes bacterium]|nr:PAS domain-containing sensor histidine kinase [Candidatus Cloacimonadota bacterium]